VTAYVPPPPGGPTVAPPIAIPTGMAPALTANIGAQLGDQGTLQFIGLAAGVYLFFYVMRQLIGLVPKRRHE